MLDESVRHGMLGTAIGEKNPLRGTREHAVQHRTPEHAPWHGIVLKREVSVRQSMLGTAGQRDGGAMTSAQRKGPDPKARP